MMVGGVLLLPEPPVLALLSLPPPPPPQADKVSPMNNVIIQCARERVFPIDRFLCIIISPLQKCVVTILRIRGISCRAQTVSEGGCKLFTPQVRGAWEAGRKGQCGLNEPSLFSKETRKVHGGPPRFRDESLQTMAVAEQSYIECA